MLSLHILSQRLYYIFQLNKLDYYYHLWRNVVAAATPYFHAMFTSGMMESEKRQYRGQDKRQRQQLVLQGLEQDTLQVKNCYLVDPAGIRIEHIAGAE